MRAVVPWWSGDGHRQRQCAHHRPWSSASVKNFPYSPSLPPPYLRCSTFPSPPLLPDTPHLVAPRRFSEQPEEDRHVKKKVRILFPGMLLLQAPFLLSLLLLLLLSRITGEIKTARGQGEGRKRKRGSWQSLRRGRITRGQDGRRLVRILFPKCG